MTLRLPASRDKVDELATWLEEQTGIGARYFTTRLTNKFPGLSTVDVEAGVSGYHLYMETADIRHETEWYGSINDLWNGQDVLVSVLPPKEFAESRYFVYAGVVSGSPFD